MKIHALLLLALVGCATQADEATSTTADSLGEGQRWKVLDVQYEVQQTGYWCGPAATRIALSARRAAPSQGNLAGQLGTTTNGTDWIGQVTGVLNANLGPGEYLTREMPVDPPTADQKNRFWDDIVRSIDGNYPLVTNIVAPPGNHPPGYPNRTIYHYFTVIGYNPDTREVYVADPANFQGHHHYWLRFDQLASLVAPKGYTYSPRAAGTSCPGGNGVVGGAIDAKYRALGGCGSVLGVPRSNELATPDGAGRYSVFDRGSIYWTERLGAFEVHGVIRDQWAALGWEPGVLGYPVSDEFITPDTLGRYNVFEKGSVYWTEKTGAHEVLGMIRDAYQAQGWEAGPLGYPTSGEYDVPGGRRSDFQHGTITWNATTQEVTVQASTTK